ncbi:MAG: hypothetical protein JO033_23175 [Acidobacteriaceae bacterium]|nr:hypothetical protein [Acidobacteriaceae bacterium]MBV9500461.1 hypothetical protein [Acidobacteriaceae bacterium]
MPNRRVEEQLEALKALGGSGLNDTSIQALRKGLGDRVNVVAARAAKTASEMQARALVPDLVQSFARLLERKRDADPQCWGKNAIAQALKELGYAESSLFLKGLQHVQMEPVWGGQVDTAITLRGICALALVQCTDLPRREILRCLVDALTDPEARVRVDAARALEEMNGEEVVLLLRLKARAGDKEAAVTGQVLESLLRLQGDEGVPFVAEFLRSDAEDIRVEAALVLGSSRLASATEVLIETWRKQQKLGRGSGVLRGLSVSRQERAIEFLLDILRNGCEWEATEAFAALELHKETEEVWARVREIVSERSLPVRTPI